MSSHHKQHTSYPFWVLFSVTVFFALLAFLPYQAKSSVTDTFLSYYVQAGIVMGENIILLLLAFFCFVLLIYLRFQRSSFFLSLFHAFGISAFGFLLSYVLLLTIAVLELGVIGVLAANSPGFFGLQTEAQAIARILHGRTTPPEVVISTNEKYSPLMAIAVASTGKDNLFGQIVLPSVPSLMQNESLPETSMLLLDNTLIITKINPRDLEIVSPVLAHKMIQSYFPDRQIKAYPKLAIMSSQEYQAHRKTDLSSRTGLIDTQIGTLSSEVSSLSGTVERERESIIADHKLLRRSATEWEIRYKKCLAGQPQASCQAIHDEWQRLITEGNKRLQERQIALQQEEKRLADAKSYTSFFESQKAVAGVQTQSFAHERGVFEPEEDSIRLVLTTDSPHAVPDYLATLLHEYLHYASFAPDGRRLQSVFFEEGLTEYFARMIIQDTLQTSTNIGYPVLTRLISEMTRLIPEREFSHIYFAKDQEALEEALDRVYGDNFYRTNYPLFESLQFSSGSRQGLALANKFMKQIDGPELTEKDLLSTYSTTE